MTALLEIDDLTVQFPLSRGLADVFLPGPAPGLDVLAGISLSLEKGETLGLVGESGSGKTTLARAVMGLLPHQAGAIRLEGQTLKTALDFKAMRRSAAMMFQDPVAAFSPRMTIGSLITEPLLIHHEPMADRAAKARELLDQVGLPAHFAGRYPHELSGGQARRASVARALALRPRLLMADEPTAGLDVSVQGEILNLLSGLKAELGLSYLVITHNLAMVRHVADRMAVLYLGRLMETGPTQDLFAKPLHPYTQSLVASEPKPDPRQRRTNLAISGEIPSLINRPSGCPFHTRCPIANTQCRTEMPELKRHATGRMVRCHLVESTDHQQKTEGE